MKGHVWKDIKGWKWELLSDGGTLLAWNGDNAPCVTRWGAKKKLKRAVRLKQRENVLAARPVDVYHFPDKPEDES